MRFTPIAENEIGRPLAEGDYNFKIIECELKDALPDRETGKVFKQMALKFEVKKPDGSTSKQSDWIRCDWVEKLYHLCVCVGIKSQYDSGVLEPRHLLNKTGRFTIGKKKDSKYMRVESYLPRGDAISIMDEPNDDVPF